MQMYAISFCSEQNFPGYENNRLFSAYYLPAR